MRFDAETVASDLSVTYFVLHSMFILTIQLTYVWLAMPISVEAAVLDRLAGANSSQIIKALGLEHRWRWKRLLTRVIDQTSIFQHEHLFIGILANVLIIGSAISFYYPFRFDHRMRLVKLPVVIYLSKTDELQSMIGTIQETLLRRLLESGAELRRRLLCAFCWSQVSRNEAKQLSQSPIRPLRAINQNKTNCNEHNCESAAKSLVSSITMQEQQVNKTRNKLLFKPNVLLDDTLPLVELGKNNLYQEIELLTRQEKYLNDLLAGDRSQLRPVAYKWHSSQLFEADRQWANKLWLKIYIYSYTELWLTLTLTIFFSAYNANQFIMSKNQRCTIWVRQHIAYTLLQVLPVLKETIKGASCTLLDTLYQSKILLAIQADLRRLIGRLNELRLAVAIERCATGDQQDGHWKQVIAPNIKFECDREAIRIYIQFKCFAQNLRPLLGSISYMADLSVVFVALFMLAGLLVYRFAKAAELPYIGASTLIIVITIDLAFFLIVSLSTACARTDRLIWSLLANAQVAPQTSGVTESQTPSDAANLATGGHGLALLSSHSMLLWRRLVLDESQFSRKFCCLLFNSYYIDNLSVLRLNIYAASLVMLYVTYSQSP